MDRRDFLKMMGVASGASLLAGCDLGRNSEKLIPYLVPPEDGVIPGDASFVSTTCTECPMGCGASARIREGRPVKLDGLESHPVGKGALCIRGQASMNRLYNPSRIRSPLMQDGSGTLAPVTWNQAMAKIASALRDSGEKLFLSGHTSGSLAQLIGEFCEGFGIERLPEFERNSHAAIRAANEELFGLSVLPTYRIDRADFLLTIGADILETFPNPVNNSAAIADKASDEHFNWYHAEPHATVTGFKARHRVTLHPGSEAYLLAYLLRELRERRIFTDRGLEDHITAIPAINAADVSAATGMSTADIEAIARGLLAARHPLVIAGGVSTAGKTGYDTARLAALLQLASGMIGSTVDFTHVADYSRMGSLADIDALVSRLESKSADVIFILGTDPVGLLPNGESLARGLDKSSFVVGIGDTLTPTMQRCDIVLPASHSLESWGDVEPHAGTVSVIQPAFEPLFDTLADGDILIRMMAEAGKPAMVPMYQTYTYVRWIQQYGPAAATSLVETGYFQHDVTEVAPALRGRLSTPYTFVEATRPKRSLAVVPSVRWYDGRSRELPLLSEIPDPLTSVSWDEWVSVSLESAKELGVGDRDELEISSNGWSVRLPVRLQPGLAKDVFVVAQGIDNPPLGWSRESGEVDAYIAATVTSTRRRVPLTLLSGSLYEEGRAAVPGNPPGHFGHSEGHTGHQKHEDVSFNPKPDYPEYRWAMAVDMDRCVACSACVAACYIENNVPMTGRDEHLKGREMSWLKVEPYYSDEGADFVLSMCQQCDAAPCESVCPVFATYHTTEGLNAQVYNRCVGTRYCANNCPYKQRRFNWFAWNHREEPLDLMVNPDVSVRPKGVMEKCSFCVQRIRKARHIARDEDRKIADGEVVPACAQACPGNAIAFGNLLDEDSEVAQWARSERSNRLLEELGTSPGVYYLRNKREGDHHGA